jgi:hypothetical protein
MKITVKYYLKSGINISSEKIDLMRHLFPLSLIDGQLKRNVIVALKNRYKYCDEIFLKIHESGRLKAIIF